MVSPIFDFSFGTSGTGNGQFTKPEDIAIDSSGNIYIADTANNRIQKFDSAGNYLSKFGSYGTANGRFNAASGIAIDSSGNIYVVDTYNNRIQKFDSAGNYLSKFGSYGTGNGKFNAPEDIAIDSSGNIFVVDVGNNRIQKFNSTGSYLSKFGSAGSGNGQLNAPNAIAIDSSGNIYVADTNNNRIQKFDSAGNYLSKFGSYGTANGQFKIPQGVSLDGYGNIIVSDYGNHRIQKFDSSGNFVLSFGTYGNGEGQFNHPDQVTMSGLRGFLADEDNNRIWVFHFPEPPVADDQRISTAQDTPILITLTASDVNNDPLTYSIVTSPSHGIIAGSAPSLVYTPAMGYSGTDSFTFKANDGIYDSNVATIQIDVAHVNHAPTANAQSVTTNEDTQKSITVTASDPDGDTLQYIMISDVQHGSISGTLPNVIYTPSLNYFGSDSFTFKANDGLVDSNTATISISINPVNDPPVAYDVNATLNEDNSINTATIPYPQSDVENDPLTLIIVTPLSHGTLTGDYPNQIYTPDPNYYGTDCLTFKVNDGEYDSNIARACAIILPVNDPPVAQSQSVQAYEDIPRSITLNATDVENDPLTYQVMAQPSHGALSGSAPNLVYTPSLNYFGSDSFTFKAYDGTDYSNIRSIAITINPVNDPPIAYSMNFTTPENTPFVNTVPVAFDVEGDPLEYILVSPPSHGNLTGTLPFMTYTPDFGYVGLDSFAFKVNDGEFDSNEATLYMMVGPETDQPVAHPQSVVIDEDTTVAVTLEATDPAGDPLTYQIVTTPSHGSLAGTAPNIIYTPQTNYYGSDSFSFKANDGLDDSNTATVSITINPVNDPPVAYDVNVTMYEDTTYTTLGQDLQGAYDVENDTLSYTLLSMPSHGTLSGVWPDIIYTPDPNYYGTDCLTFKVNDGEFDSNVATACAIVRPVNDPPVAYNQQITVTQNTLAYITLTASDVENDTLSYSIVAQPSHGLLFGTAPNLRYEPSSNYLGTDYFTFRANDGNATSLPATISITMTQQTSEEAVSSQVTTTNPLFRSGIDISGFTVSTVGDNAEKSVSYDLAGSVAAQTLKVNTGEKIRASITLADQVDSTKIIHFGLYANIRKTTSDIKNSDAYVVFDMGSPVKVVNTGGIFKDATLDTSYEGRSMTVDVTMTFTKPMQTSDIILEAWNEGRRPIYKTIPAALEVVETESVEESNVSGTVTLPEQLSKEPIRVFSTAGGKVTEIKNNDVVVIRNRDLGVKISGFIEGEKRGDQVKIAIMRPDNSIYYLGAFLNEDGSYVTLTKLDTKWQSGQYEILVNCMDKDRGEIRFFVTDKESAKGQYGVVLDHPERLSEVCKYLHGKITKEKLVSYLLEIGWSKYKIDNFLENNKPAYFNPYTYYVLAALVPLLYVLVSFLSKGKNLKRVN